MAKDWYQYSSDLRPDMVFHAYDGGLVMLDRRVPGDGTQWYVANWCPPIERDDVDPIYRTGHWSYDDSTIEPGDLVGEPIADPAEQVPA